MFLYFFVVELGIYFLKSLITLENIKKWQFCSTKDVLERLEMDENDHLDISELEESNGDEQMMADIIIDRGMGNLADRVNILPAVKIQLNPATISLLC